VKSGRWLRIVFQQPVVKPGQQRICNLCSKIDFSCKVGRCRNTNVIELHGSRTATSSPLLRRLSFRPRACRPGRLLLRCRLSFRAFRKSSAAGLAIPFLKGVRGDLPLDEQLSELAPLSLALERHARESNAASTSDKTPGVGRLDIPPGVLCGTGDPNPGYGGRTRAARASAIAGRQLRELAGRPSLLARSVHSSRPDLRRDSSQRHH